VPVRLGLQEIGVGAARSPTAVKEGRGMVRAAPTASGGEGRRVAQERD
jgi:hypothetical protein